MLSICGFEYVHADAVLISAVGGPIPINYTPVNFSAYPASPLNASILTDKNPATGITLTGLDNALQSNGFRSDTGSFALVKFRVDPGTTFLRFDALAQVTYAAPNDTLFINVLTPSDGHYHEVIYGLPARTPTLASVWFDINGNNGNFPLWQSISINDIIDTNNIVTFAVEGSFVAQVNEPGAVVMQLDEVFAAPAPLPRSAIGGALLMALAACVRSNRLPLPGRLRKS